MTPVFRALLAACLLGLGLVFWVGGASAVLTITVGGNVNVTAAGGNQTEGTIAINPTNPLQLFAASNPGACLYCASKRFAHAAASGRYCGLAGAITYAPSAASPAAARNSGLSDSAVATNLPS